MENENMVLEIPYGTRDFLPREAAEKRGLETRLARLFGGWGYDEIVTPTIEYLDNLTLSGGSVLEPHMFKLFDRTNRTLALRHEMTTPLARVASSRLKDEPLPLKLFAVGPVFRYEQSQTGRQCEFYQAGVELMGSPSPAADAEVLALCVETLRAAGLKDFRLYLGQVEFINGIMEQYPLTEAQQAELRSYLEKRNLVALEKAVDAMQIPVPAKQTLKKLPLLSGGEEMLEQAYGMALSEKSRRALDNLSAIYRLLKAYGVADAVQFDLGIIRDFGYYTGMVFEGYAPGLGFSLCGGGRYDHLLSSFGNPCPATGFAVGIERLLLARAAQGGAAQTAAAGVYVGYAAGRDASAIEKALALRAEGRQVELAMRPQSEQEAKRSADARQAAVVYVA